MCSLVNNNTPSGVKSPVEEMLRYIKSLPQDPPKAREEIKSRRFWMAIWAEFVSTFILTVVASASTHESDVRQSLAVGCTSGLLTYTLHGVAFNPAVVLARFLVSRVSLLKFFISIFVQAVGAIAGSVLVFALRNEFYQTVESELKLSQVFGVEFLGSLVIVLVVLTSDDDIENGLLKFQALPVGVAYGATTLFSFSSTGIGLNPARALGPAILTQEMDRHWVYWVGPLLGALIGGFTYDYARSSRKDVHERAKKIHRKAITESLKRDFSALSGETELTNSLTTNDCRV